MKNKGYWIFFASVLFLFLLTILLDTQKGVATLLVFLSILKKILPLLLILFLLMALADAFLKPKLLMKYLGKKAGLKGWLLTIALGILSSGPIYMWYPLLKDLQEKGLRTGYLAAFLHARAIKIPMLPLMIGYFGIMYTLVITGVLLIFSFIQGIIIEKIGGVQENEISNSI